MNNEVIVSAKDRATEALAEARRAILEMLAAVDPVVSGHDDLADLIQSVHAVGDFWRDIRKDMEATVLAWLLENEEGVRSIRVGETKYWGEKEKSVRCLDVGEAGVAAAVSLHGPDLLAVTYGDETAMKSILDVLRELFRRIVSSSGLKEAATRDAIMDGAERELRARYEAEPFVIEVAEGQTEAEALSLAVETAREAAYLAYFEESWPDKIKGGEPKVKLGVGNLRFVHRRGGGSKKELEEMERARLAGGEE